MMRIEMTKEQYDELMECLSAPAKLHQELRELLLSPDTIVLSRAELEGMRKDNPDDLSYKAAIAKGYNQAINDILERE